MRVGVAAEAVRAALPARAAKIFERGALALGAFDGVVLAQDLTMACISGAPPWRRRRSARPVRPAPRRQHPASAPVPGVELSFNGVERRSQRAPERALRGLGEGIARHCDELLRPRCDSVKGSIAVSRRGRTRALQVNRRPANQRFSGSGIMSVKVAINGFGRIGRNVLRAIYEVGPHGHRSRRHQRSGPGRNQRAPAPLRQRPRHVSRAR